MEVFKLIGKLGLEGTSRVKSKLEDVGGKAGKARKAFRRLGDMMKTSLKVGATAAAGAVTAMTTSSIRQFTRFDEKMREVYTLIPDASERMQESLSSDIRKIGEDYGFLTDDTVPALYQAISAGVPPDNVMTFMQTAAKSAKAGVTDLQTSVDGLTSAVNAYGQNVLNAQEASDIMFTAVRLGKTTYEELAASMSTVTPIASSLGIQFQDVNAALATMTAQGMDTGRATIYLRAMLNQLSKDGSDANNVFKDMADVTFAEFIDQGNSLADALELMEKYANQNNTTIKKLFANVRAGTGALQLSGSNMGTFVDNLDEMNESAGATETAYQKMSESIQQTLDELRAWWENQRIEIGKDLEDQLRSLLKWLQNNEEEISNTIEGMFERLVELLKWLKNNKKAVVGTISAIGGAIAAAGIGQLIMLLSNPVVAALLGVGAAAGGIGYGISQLGNKTEDTKKSVKELTKQINTLEKSINKLEKAKEKPGRGGTFVSDKNLDAQIDRLKERKKELEDLREEQNKRKEIMQDIRADQAKSEMSQRRFNDELREGGNLVRDYKGGLEDLEKRYGIIKRARQELGRFKIITSTVSELTKKVKQNGQAWKDYSNTIERNLSDLIENMITDFKNFGDYLEQFFDRLTQQIISDFADDIAEGTMHVIENAGESDGGGGGNWFASLLRWGIETGGEVLASMQSGGKVSGETLTRLGENDQEEYVVPMDKNIMSELAEKITKSMSGGGEIGEVHVYQVEGMSDRAFVDGVQRNADSVKAQIIEAVKNNEGLRQQLRKALA